MKLTCQVLVAVCLSGICASYSIGQRVEGTGDQLSSALNAAYGDLNLEDAIDLWGQCADDEPSKFLAAILMLDRAVDTEIAKLDAVISYLSEGKWDRKTASLAMDRLLSHPSSEQGLGGFAFVIASLPAEWVASYARSTDPSVMSFSNPARVEILLEVCIGRYKFSNEALPNWIIVNVKRLSTLGGAAAYLHAAYAPVDASVIEAIANVANSDRIAEVQLVILRRLRREILLAHRDELNQKITREPARKILLVED